MRTPDGEESFNGPDATAFRERRTTPEMVTDVRPLPGSALDHWTAAQGTSRFSRRFGHSHDWSGHIGSTSLINHCCEGCAVDQLDVDPLGKSPRFGRENARRYDKATSGPLGGHRTEQLTHDIGV
jgi:hypothetical protein